MNLSDRRIINIFKSFMEKVFVPQLPKMDASCQQEWNKFSAIVFSDQINVGEAQIYVDSLPGLTQSLPTLSRPNLNQPDIKPTFFMRQKKEVPEESSGGFNPSKTFGGERARMMFPLKDFDDGANDRQNYNFSKDFSKQKEDGPAGYTTQMVLPTLERLFKIFNDNQSKLDKPTGFNQVPQYDSKMAYI